MFGARLATEFGRTGYLERTPHTEATTGVGMLARQFVLGEPRSPHVRDAADYLADFAENRWGGRGGSPGGPDYYLWYNCTLAMFQAGGEAWQRWNDVVRDQIVRLQRRDSCQRGSWDPSDKWGTQGGRIYSTALATLALEVYYRYAPHSEWTGDEVELTVTTREADAAPEVELPVRSDEQLPDLEKEEEAMRRAGRGRD